MDHAENRCILWVGDKHSGKTTAATKLIECLQEEGCTAGGILAPSIYADDLLVGFDIVDIQNDLRVPLAVQNENACGAVPYKFYEKGLELGHLALGPVKNKAVDLVVMDEYGPLELDGQGWRDDVDRLLEQNYPPVLLIVRRDVAEEVKLLYKKYNPFLLESRDTGSIERMLVFVLEQRNKWMKKCGKK